LHSLANRDARRADGTLFAKSLLMPAPLRIAAASGTARAVCVPRVSTPWTTCR
jgi:hypothetical protein